MRVILNKTVYEMTRKQFKGLLEVPKKKTAMCIFAVEKGGMAEMKNERYDSIEDLENAVGEYEQKGFKVYWNGR